jgi:hypothetical protein
MQLKLKILTGLIALPLSFNTFAGDENLVGDFKTIKDVSIAAVGGSQITMSGLHLPNASECTFAVTADSTATTYPGDIVMKIGTGNGDNEGLTMGSTDPTGAGGCVANTDGEYGLFVIDGSPGAAVTITITDQLAGFIEFKPKGCAANYVSGNNGDSCDIVDGTAPVAIRLAGPLDLITDASSTPVAGQALLALGGQAKALAQLNPGQQYTVTYDVSVAY